MKLAKSLVILLILAVSLIQVNVAHADAVQITGHVYDTQGRPVNAVRVAATGLTDPSIFYEDDITDARGYFSLSLKRPERIKSGLFPPFYKGRPIYEGYRMEVGTPTDGRYAVLTDNTIMVNAEGRDVIEQDFKLKPAGAIKLSGYTANGSPFAVNCHQYRPGAGCLTYVTDLHWRAKRSSLLDYLGVLLVAVNETNVINIAWDVPGFGKVILRADNDGKGFVPTVPGETISINLNYELARTEFRLLNESYARYLREGYVFSQEISPSIESAQDFLREAGSAVRESQAHFADACLNRTLWTGERLELEKAQQDIEKYRKGDATLSVVDENGKPVEHAKVTITQTSHDFLFGADLEKANRVYEAQLMREAGTNHILLQYAGIFLSGNPLEHFSFQPISSLETLKKMGMHLGAWQVIAFEPNRMAYAPYLWNLSFEELRTKIHEDVYNVVRRYADYIDYWIVISANPSWQLDSLGYTLQQVMDLYYAGVKAVREADPTSQILVFEDDADAYTSATVFQGPDDDFTTDFYTFMSRLADYGIDNVGLTMWAAGSYGSVYELCTPTPTEGTTEYPFRDLASVSRILDWYGTLNMPMHITGFAVPSNYTSSLGYWHRRSWDEELKVEWIQKAYTITFAKPHMREISYFWDAIPCDDLFISNIGLFDAEAAGHHVPRKSFLALKRLITEDWTTRLSVKTDANGQVEFRGFAGNYSITVTVGDLVKNFTLHIAEQESKTYKFRFDKKEIVQEMEAQRTVLRDSAKSLIGETDQISQWLASINPDRSAEVRNATGAMMLLYNDGQYAEVIELGRKIVANPLGIRLNGRLTDFQGFSPIARDPQLDLLPGSPRGTDLTDIYALADSSYLYLGIRVAEDNPNRNVGYYARIRIGSEDFLAAIERNGTYCRCWEDPCYDCGVDCSFAVGELVEMQIPLEWLKWPDRIYLDSVSIRHGPEQEFDAWHGPPIEIPNFKSFTATSTLQSETTMSTTSAVSPSGETVVSGLTVSLSYIAPACGIVILCIVVAYWGRHRSTPRDLQRKRASLRRRI